MANNNVILISLKAIVTLNHNHNHMPVETMKICSNDKKKLGKIQEIQCNETSMEIQPTENKLNITHFDKVNRPQQNTMSSISQVSIKNNKINDPIENNHFECFEEYDKYILVENVHTQNVLDDNNENELNQLMSDYDTVNEMILQQFRSNPNYFKSAIKHYTLALKDNLTSKKSLLNALHSFGDQLKGC